MPAQGLAAHVEDEQQQQHHQQHQHHHQQHQQQQLLLKHASCPSAKDELGELDAAVEVLSLLAVTCTKAQILTPEALHRVGGDR
jgi:hypothetical protein